MPTPRTPAAPQPDRFTLYELAVTAPAALSRCLRAVHARTPAILREDYSGSAALARGWIATIPGGTAIAVDADPEPFARIPATPGLRAVRSDVLACRLKADVIAATNFPVGYSHTRDALLAYLRHARACLNPRGILACDIYGGRDAFTHLALSTTLHLGPEHHRRRVTYTWEQRTADPLTARVTNAMHFKVAPSRIGARDGFTLTDAFTYNWRLWSIPELRDAMLDAGFAAVEVYADLGDAIDSDGHAYVTPITDPAELPENYVVYVVGRTDRRRPPR